MNIRFPNGTVLLENPPHIISSAAVGGKKEGEGPLGDYFSYIVKEGHFGQRTWEKGEMELQKEALQFAVDVSPISLTDINFIFSGDLLNQCIASSFAHRSTDASFIGMYGACSTFAEGLALSAMFVNSGYADYSACCVSSHFCSAERQYRFPVEYGGQRPPTSQWTVTGAGAAFLSAEGVGPTVTACTIGSITDLGIKDANNMGAAMAPAALSTIRAHFEDTKSGPEDFDLIVTGDLGQHGKDALLTLAQNEGIPLGGKICDCGTMVFDLLKQDVHSGGSGCGCSAITLCGYLLDQLHKRKYKKILFCGTGALLSPTSTQQGLPIPGVCHAISICGG